jgi:hypothetical protein
MQRYPTILARQIRYTSMFLESLAQTRTRRREPGCFVRGTDRALSDRALPGSLLRFARPACWLVSGCCSPILSFSGCSLVSWSSVAGDEAWPYLQARWRAAAGGRGVWLRFGAHGVSFRWTLEQIKAACLDISLSIILQEVVARICTCWKGGALAPCIMDVWTVMLRARVSNHQWLP